VSTKRTTSSRPAAPAEAPSGEAPAADVAPDGLSISPPVAPRPATAPLDPPASQAPDSPAAVEFVTLADTGVLLARHAAENDPGTLIIDAATGRTPEVDGLFEAVTPYGNARRLTRRLLQRTVNGGRVDTFVLLGAGAILDAARADELTALVQAQTQA
jgi:hypothetical protein